MNWILMNPGCCEAQTSPVNIESNLIICFSHAVHRSCERCFCTLSEGFLGEFKATSASSVNDGLVGTLWFLSWLVICTNKAVVIERHAPPTLSGTWRIRSIAKQIDSMLLLSPSPFSPVCGIWSWFVLPCQRPGTDWSEERQDRRDEKGALSSDCYGFLQNHIVKNGAPGSTCTSKAWDQRRKR